MKTVTLCALTAGAIPSREEVIMDFNILDNGDLRITAAPTET